MVGGTIWEDLDGDGVYDTHYTEGGYVATTTTDADGSYVFDGLAAGAYVVEVNGERVEVDREGELADTVLGSRGIPMSYALRDGTVTATLRGQRSAEDLLDYAEFDRCRWGSHNY